MHVDLKKYMGKWFEIARIKNEFEPNMKKVTAQYNLNEDDTIQVINSGYIDDTLKEIIGIAKTTNENNLLLISFRHPIYSHKLFCGSPIVYGGEETKLNYITKV